MKLPFIYNYLFHIKILSRTQQNKKEASNINPSKKYHTLKNLLRTVQSNFFKHMAQQKNQELAQFVDHLAERITNVLFLNNQDKVLQQLKGLFPSQFMTSIDTILSTKINSQQQKNLALAYKLIEINELCLYHLAQRVTQMQSQSENSFVQISARSQRKHINENDYIVLEEAIQKAEQQVRKHIGIEHQMKICLEQVEEDLNQLANKNKELKKENSFLKKQLSSAKKSQIEALNKLNQVEQRFQSYQQKLRANKPFNKLNTEPQAQILNDTSRKSFRKSFETTKQKHPRRPLITKGTGIYSKLGSRKQSKLGMRESDIDVNLNNFISLSMQMKKQQPALKTEGKQMFWNKRLKKKQSTTVHGAYGDFKTIHNCPNRSLNISPRQLRKQQKQKQLKDAYAINARDTKKNSLTITNDETVMKKRQRRDCSIGEAYQLRRSLTLNDDGPDRSRSVVN